MTSPQLLFVHALSPLHAGTGQSIGAIDLAIARDKATQFPYLPGSSLKGSLRDVARQTLKKKDTSDTELVKQLFGPDTKNASEHAGALIVSDANLLLLPVRSVNGTFAWVTSPYLLHRFARDARAANILPSLPSFPNGVEDCVIGDGSALAVKGGVAGKEERVIFEDLDLVPSKQSSLNVFAAALGKQVFAEPYWQEMLTKRICIVHDDVMTFLSEHATDVVARISLDNDTKTVKTGQLWYEESLPTESILVSLIEAQAIRSRGQEAALAPRDVIQKAAGFLNGSIQLGGKATVGRGRCQLRLSGGPS